MSLNAPKVEGGLYRTKFYIFEEKISRKKVFNSPNLGERGQFPTLSPLCHDSTFTRALAIVKTQN